MGIHVLLSKSDKLKRSESTQVLRESKARLEGTATVQLFSVLDKTGVAEAQRVLQDWTR
jgi:GTP-binding protein EngB required for normal cell division